MRKRTKKPKLGAKILVSVGAFGAKGGKFTQTATVEELLSSQFITTIHGETAFYFYRDRGVTWINE